MKPRLKNTPDDYSGFTYLINVFLYDEFKPEMYMMILRHSELNDGLKPQAR
tara:strand:- start:253 stop:405 length:153 start_codon:yes stop_codon:yes gene_type:complete